MKSLLLAATVAAGLLVSASSADAQWRARRGAVYSSPSYGYSYSTPYGYSTYASPTYSGEVVTSSYSTPTYTSGTVYSNGSYYSPSYSYPMSSYPTYYNNGYNNNGYYNNSGLYVSPSGNGYWNGRRIWR
jgi:hypothetical protein